MRILLVHNYTKGFATGGESHVFEDEAEILKAHGHEVYKLFCSNSEATDASIIGKIRYFLKAPWSDIGYKRMADAIREFKPDVVHVHNFFLVFSPSVFKAAYDLHVPVVLTLHNYRMASPCSQLLRNNRTCELCVGRNPWRILLYRCYRDSFWASLLRYRIYYSSRKKYKWERYISAFVVLTEFGKMKMIQAGLPDDKLFVVPNCTPDPLDGIAPTSTGNGAVFIGRLSREKGIKQLIEAWKEIEYPLIIIGEGDLQEALESCASDNVRFCGLQNRENVIRYCNECAFIVFPSVWYEGLPLVIIESMSIGRPLAVSGHGAIASVVEDGATGLHFEPGNIRDMRKKIQRLIDDSELRTKLSQNGREEYLEKYTPETHYQNLINIYKKVINETTYPAT